VPRCPLPLANQFRLPDGRLYRQAHRNHRYDDIVKAEILAELKADDYQPVIAFDDRDRVVKLGAKTGCGVRMWPRELFS
jgi:hypothetical protein